MARGWRARGWPCSAGVHDFGVTYVRSRIYQSSRPPITPRAADEADLLGGLLFGATPPTYHVRWLVVSGQARGQGVGRALMTEAMRRFIPGPGIVEVVTFGADHPGASASGARIFYERLGFTPAEAAAPGPEGGSRQIYRKTVT